MLEVLVRGGAGLDGWEAGREVIFILVLMVGFGAAGAGEGVWECGFAVEVWGVGGC